MAEDIKIIKHENFTFLKVGLSLRRIDQISDIIINGKSIFFYYANDSHGEIRKQTLDEAVKWFNEIIEVLEKYNET